MSVDGLTKRQAAVFEFVVAWKRAHDGCSPSYSDIMEGCGISSSSEVARMVKCLVEKGFLETEYAQPRTLRVVGGFMNLEGLSERQADVFRFVVEWKRAHDGCAPSFEEIRVGCGFGNRSQVHRMVDILVKKGVFVGGEDYVPRSLQVVGGFMNVVLE